MVLFTHLVLWQAWWACAKNGGWGEQEAPSASTCPAPLLEAVGVRDRELHDGEDAASHLGPQPVSDLELGLITHCSLCLISRSCHTHRATISLWLRTVGGEGGCRELRPRPWERLAHPLLSALHLPVLPSASVTFPLSLLGLLTITVVVLTDQSVLSVRHQEGLSGTWPLRRNWQTQEPDSLLRQVRKNWGRLSY